MEGLEHLAALDGPVVFAANHQSHMDTPVILAALPGRAPPARGRRDGQGVLRRALPPRRPLAAGALHGQRLYYLAALFFNAFPLPQREAGARRTLRYIGELVSEGWSVLIFPEGRRTEAGEINEFKPGVGMIGSRLGVPVVPVRLEGVDRVLHQSWRMARRGRVRVAFGPPIRLDGDDYAKLALRVESAVRGL